jgi:thioredoxin reductase (NADPH)
MLDVLTRLDSYEAYAVPLLGAWALYAVISYRRERRNRAVRDTAVAAGLSEPPSLHPIIDPALCFGCGACAHACPEGGSVLGLINGKAELIDPTSCIGHGACKTACPVKAIDLVFGTATRGVDIPNVSPTFETNVPGLFIAGELGGMGLIANAVEQGRQAITAIANLDGLKRRDQYDVLIIGAGPAGIAASLAAKEKGLSALTVEQSSLGGTVAHYPRGKIVMTKTAVLPLHGKVRFRKVGKERLLGLWHSIINTHRIPITYGVRVDDIQARAGGFDIATERTIYPARAVLLATGRRGSPRRLGVAGEEQDKVVYMLADARQYRGQSVLVVGGGDTALEAAAALVREGGIEVTLCHRGSSFTRARASSRAAIETAVRDRKMSVLFETSIVAIHGDRVDLQSSRGPSTIRNQFVIICVGGVVPSTFLRRIGVEVETKFGTR